MGKRDETFYWSDNVTFSAEDTHFRISPYPFILGSEYFVEKYGLLSERKHSGAKSIIRFEGVTADHFRVFLRFLFPIHLTSTTSTFTKKEWLTILTLSTLWHFHEARSLAIQHLDGHLADIELILVGRAVYVPRWVLEGYRAIIEKPTGYTLPDHIGDTIGHRELNRLWAVRYDCAVFVCDDDFVGEALGDKFREELAELAARELEHRTKAERDAEERHLRGKDVEKEWDQTILVAKRNSRESNNHQDSVRRGVEGQHKSGRRKPCCAREVQTATSKQEPDECGRPQLEQAHAHRRTGERSASDKERNRRMIFHGEPQASERQLEYEAVDSMEEPREQWAVYDSELLQQEQPVEATRAKSCHMPKAARQALKSEVKQGRKRLHNLQTGS